MADAVDLAFRYDSEIIVEENIEGFEVGCAVLGNDELILGRVDEIELSHGFFDYKEKYTQRTAKIHMPARIDADTEERIRKACKDLQSVGLQRFCRVDMFLTPSGRLCSTKSTPYLAARIAAAILACCRASVWIMLP